MVLREQPVADSPAVSPLLPLTRQWGTPFLVWGAMAESFGELEVVYGCRGYLGRITLCGPCQVVFSLLGQAYYHPYLTKLSP